MTEFSVIVVDNYSSPGDDAWYTEGRYATYEEALATAKAHVDGSIRDHLKPGITAAALLGDYRSWGERTVISPTPKGQPEFSGWDYANTRCAEIIAVAEQQGKSK